MSKTTHVVFLTAALALSVGNAAAIPYTFTSIVDTSGPLDPSFGFVSLNNSGTVAFVGSLDTGEYGIFTGNGGPTTTIADTSGPFGFFGFGSSPSLNNSGTVAFYAFANTTGLPGIFTGNGGPIMTIADSSGPFDFFFDGEPSLNNSGAVAFVGSLDTGEYGIFTGNGGPTTTIADTSGPFGFFGFGRSPSLNNSGTVAFYAFANTTSLPGIFTGNGGPTTTIADFRTGPFFDYRFPSLNDSGTVAFAAVAGSDEHGAFTGGEGIFTGNGGPITTIADRSGPFDDFLAGG